MANISTYFGGGGGAINPGDFIITSIDSEIPTGYVEAGKVYNQSDYPELYCCIGIVHDVVSRCESFNICFAGNGTGGVNCFCNGTGCCAYFVNSNNCFICPSSNGRGIGFSCTDQILVVADWVERCCNASTHRSPFVYRIDTSCTASCCATISAPLNTVCSTNNIFSSSSGDSTDECKLGGNTNRNSRMPTTWATDGKCRALIVMGPMVRVCQQCNLPGVRYIYTTDGGCTVTNAAFPTTGYVGQNSCTYNCCFQGHPPLYFHDPKSDKFIVIPIVSNGCYDTYMGCGFFRSSNLTTWTCTNLTFCDGFYGNTYNPVNCCGNCIYVGAGLGWVECTKPEDLRVYYNKTLDCTFLYFASESTNFYSYDDATATLMKWYSNEYTKAISDSIMLRKTGSGLCPCVEVKPFAFKSNTNGYGITYSAHGVYTAEVPLKCQCGIFANGVTTCYGKNRYVLPMKETAAGMGQPIFSVPTNYCRAYGINSKHEAIQINHCGSVACDTCSFNITKVCLISYDYTTKFYVPIPEESSALLGINGGKTTHKYLVKT